MTRGEAEAEARRRRRGGGARGGGAAAPRRRGGGAGGDDDIDDEKFTWSIVMSGLVTFGTRTVDETTQIKNCETLKPLAAHFLFLAFWHFGIFP